MTIHSIIIIVQESKLKYYKKNPAEPSAGRAGCYSFINPFSTKKSRATSLAIS